MKKLLFIFALIAVMVSVTGCSNESKKQLKQVVAELDSQCPEGMDELGELFAVQYDDEANEVLFIILINEDEVSLDDFKTDEEIYLQGVKWTLYGEENREFLDLMIDVGSSLSFVLKSFSTGESVKLHYSLEDLKEIRDNPMTEDEIYYEKNRLTLDDWLSRRNSECPIIIDDGWYMTKAFIEGENVVYLFEINDQIWYMSDIKNFTEDLKQSMLKDAVPSNLEALLHLNMGFVYRFSATSSGETYDIVLSKDRIIDYLHQE